MEFITLHELVKLFRQAKYEDGTPVSFYLLFPTAEDCPRGKGDLWLWPLRENKVEWWSALVDRSIASELHTGKYDGNMCMVRLGTQEKPLRLHGIREDDLQFTNQDRNLARGALGKKVKNYWDLQAKEGLKEVYEDLFRLVGDADRCLQLEAEYLKRTLFFSAWCRASLVNSRTAIPGGQLTEKTEAAQENFQQMLSCQSDSLWSLIVQRLEQMETGQWDTMRKLLNDGTEESQRVEILAALVLLALNAGELLDQPERHAQYEQLVMQALARRLSKKSLREQRDDVVPRHQEPEIDFSEPDLEEVAPLESVLPVMLQQRIRMRRQAANPKLPAPDLCYNENKKPRQSQKFAPLKKKEAPSKVKLPEALQSRIKERRATMKPVTKEGREIR